MTRYVLPTGKTFRVPDDKLEKFLQEYPDAVKQEANQASESNIAGQQIGQKVTRFFNEEGKSIRVRDKDLDKFRKENPGYMTREEIEKQIADYKDQIKKSKQKEKERKAKAEEDRRIYENRIKEGFAKHKGEELGGSQTHKQKAAYNKWISENNPSIEEMEKYLNDNNFDYVIKGGEQDKGGTIGDEIEAIGSGLYMALDRFLGDFNFSNIQQNYISGKALSKVDQKREREILEYDPNLYNTKRAEYFKEIERLQKEQELLEKDSEKYNQLQDQINQTKAEIPSEFKVYKQIEVEDAFDQYDNLVGATLQIGSDGEGRGMLGGKNQKLLNEDGTFKDFMMLLLKKNYHNILMQI